MSYMDLLRSSPAGLVGDDDMFDGIGRATGRGASRPAGRPAGRGTSRGAGQGAGRGAGRAAAPTRRPITTASQQFLPPRPAGGRSNGATPSVTAGRSNGATPTVTDDDFDGVLQEPGTSSWRLNPNNEEADDLQILDASITSSTSGDDDESASKSSSSDEDPVQKNALLQLELSQQFGAMACMFVHPRLRSPRFSPHFDNCIGAMDGTHIPVVVPSAKVLQHVGRHGYSSQNVLAICDFDMRFTFAVAGWPGSVHDMRVFSDAINKYGDKFPHPPQGKFYLVDSGYPNRPGYFAPYKGTKYHLPEFQQGPRPRGKKEVFNYLHSSLRNVIERSIGVLKMKWRILLDLPSYPMNKQSKIILASMALHNFIRESNMRDQDFDMCDQDEEYMPMPVASSPRRSGANNHLGEEDVDMNAFRDSIANALYLGEE